MYNQWAKAIDCKQTSFAAFLDLSNAFGSVPHDALRSILPNFGIRGKLFGWFSNYLDDRHQVVHVDGCSSSVRRLNAGVPQGSVVAPSLFIMFINSLLLDISVYSETACPDGVIGTAYADDTLVSVSHEDELTAAVHLENLLLLCEDWARNWGMSFNATKTVCMRFSRRKNCRLRSINFVDTPITLSSKHTHLGICLSADLKFNEHIANICSRITKELYVLRILRKNIPGHGHLLNQLYKAYIRPHFEYCSPFLAGLGITQTEHMESLQRKAMRIILGRSFRDIISVEDYLDLQLDKLSFRRNFALACYSYKLYNELCPRALLPYKPVQIRSVYDTRRTIFRMPPTATPGNCISELFRRSPLNLAADILNYIHDPEALLNMSMNLYKQQLTTQRQNVLFDIFPNL